MADDEVGVVELHVGGRVAEEQAAEAAAAEERDDAEREQHRRLQLQLARPTGSPSMLTPKIVIGT